MKPSVGRIVHYVANGRNYAAIISTVHADTCVNLVVFEYYSNVPSIVITSVFYDESCSKNTWHWPSRVE